MDFSSLQKRTENYARFLGVLEEDLGEIFSRCLVKYTLCRNKGQSEKDISLQWKDIVTSACMNYFSAERAWRDKKSRMSYMDTYSDETYNDKWRKIFSVLYEKLDDNTVIILLAFAESGFSFDKTATYLGVERLSLLKTVYEIKQKVRRILPERIVSKGIPQAKIVKKTRWTENLQAIELLDYEPYTSVERGSIPGENRRTLPLKEYLCSH